MKIYYIGRDESVCDIVIDDQTNLTSGRHAVLKVDEKGNYTILDCSTNGTYVNGIRIDSNVEVPVTTDDVISFAHVVDFDWKILEKPKDKKRMILISSIIACFVVLSAVSAMVFLYNDSIIKRLPITSVIQCDTLFNGDTIKTGDEFHKSDSLSVDSMLNQTDDTSPHKEVSKSSKRNIENGKDKNSHPNEVEKSSENLVDHTNDKKLDRIEKKNNTETIAPTF